MITKSKLTKTDPKHVNPFALTPEQELEEMCRIARKCLQLAVEGEPTCVKICLDAMLA